MKSKLKVCTLIVCISAFFCTACKKDFVNSNANPSTDDSFKSMHISNSFDWKNERKVTLIVTPLSTPITITNTLKVTDEQNETVFYAAKANMDQPLNTFIVLPAHVGNVRVAYGSIVKTIPITNNKIQFDFITP